MINSKILDASNFDPTKSTEPFSIVNLCEKIENGDFILPIFQTYLRWTIKKQVDLFNYQLFGKAPVAPISVNVISEPEKINFVQQVKFQTRELISNDDIKGKLSVADGQQRLTTNYLAYEGDHQIDKIVLDLHKGKFISVEEKAAKFQIPVTILYNKKDKLTEYITKGMGIKNQEKFAKLYSALNKVRSKWQTYYYSVNKAIDMSKDEQQNWFSVLNLAGSRVTQDMVFLSSLLLKGVDFYKEYAEPFRVKLVSHDLLALYPRKTAEVSVPLAALNAAYEKITNTTVHVLNSSPMPSDTKPKQIATLSVDQIREMFSMTLSALDQAIKFYEDFNRFNIARMDYLTNILGYFVFANNHSLDEHAKKNINEWIKPDLFSNKSNGERRVIYQELIKKTGNIIIK